MVNLCIKNIVIKRDGTFYQCEQVIISLTALASCYIYMYLACFGADDKYLYIIIEAMFAVDMFITFFVEVPIDNRMEREINQITVNYIKTDFLFDLVPLLPLELFDFQESKLFFLLKLIRIRKGNGILSVNKIICAVKKYYQQKSQKLVQKNKQLAEDCNNDHNKIGQIILVHHSLKTIRLIFLILNVSYFFSMTWLIYCSLVDEIVMLSNPVS